MFIEDQNALLTFITVDELSFLSDYQRLRPSRQGYGNAVKDFLTKYPTFHYCGAIFNTSNGINWLTAHGVVKFENASTEPSMWDD